MLAQTPVEVCRQGTAANPCAHEEPQEAQRRSPAHRTPEEFGPSHETILAVELSCFDPNDESYSAEPQGCFL
jgi:hypothetical protein